MNNVNEHFYLFKENKVDTKIEQIPGRIKDIPPVVTDFSSKYFMVKTETFKKSKL